jgi:hypothetical protein
VNDLVHRAFLRAIGLLSLVGVSACAMTEGPPPLLGLDFEGKTCAAFPDFARAKDLVVATDKPITAKIDENTPCLVDGSGERSAYAVFGLPSSQEEYLVSVTSVPQGQTLLSPRVMMLDFMGGLLREVSNDSFTFRGTGLAIALRVRADERYLVVASDPESVGQEVSMIRSATMTTVVTTGYAYVPINTGSESEISHTFAHNGSIIVAATPIPKVK